MVIGDRDAGLNSWILRQCKSLLLLLDNREKDKRQDATAEGSSGHPVSAGIKQIQIAGELLGGDLSYSCAVEKGLHSVGVIFKGIHLLHSLRPTETKRKY